MGHANMQRDERRRVSATRGFSLIELLIVVAIILILAAIAIPNFIRARASANEASAAQSLRNIMTGLVAYSTTYGNGYAPTLGALGGPLGAVVAKCDNALLVDPVLSNNGNGNSTVKSGYLFTFIPGNVIAAAGPGCTSPGLTSFVVHGDPVSQGMTGVKRFFLDESGIIRFTNDGTLPSINSPPLQ